MTEKLPSKRWLPKTNFPRWLRITLRIFGAFVVLLLLSYIGIAWYVNAHKKELLGKITEKLNENIDGELTIGSMDPSFLKGLPRISLSLKDVVIKDAQWNVHQHTLLDAKNFDVSVNTLALLRGAVEIRIIEISNAKIYLYTDANGYSNTSIFKSKKNDTKKESSDGATEIKRFYLDNVSLVIDNKKGNKLFQFDVDKIDGRMDYSFSDWEAKINLKTYARSLAFNTVHGSFIKDKLVQGTIAANYDSGTKNITVLPNNLDIGEDRFNIGGKFSLGDTADFTINIKTNILWRNASALLSRNISQKLDLFNLEKPIDVSCDLIGNFDAEGDPSIIVTAQVKENVLTIPDATIKECSFTGVFTNEYVAGKGFSDANSAVKLLNFAGSYEEIPFTMQKAFIVDFDHPMAIGDFKSKFDLKKLNNIIGDDLLQFYNGKASVEVTYKAPIENFKLTKPLVEGLIEVENANLNYIPRHLNFKNTTISLNFNNDDLFIKNIKLQSGKSIVFMEGSVNNFLNLYYTAPEKIVLNWKIRSPQLHLGEFLGFLGQRKQVAAVRKKSRTTNFTKEMNSLFEKSNVNMQLKVDKLYYKKFLATNATASILLSESGINLNNVSVQHAGGTATLNGKLYQQGKRNQYQFQTNVNNVDIQKFFYSFDNFGMQSFTSKNLKGFLTAKAAISGAITDSGDMVPGTMNGNLSFDIKKGALIGFDPIRNVGKFAFPLRDLNTITFTNLNGKFDIKGELVTINPMQINSSVLNMDIAGIYSFSKGTNIALDIPLRNPKNDKNIVDKEERKLRRKRGIVLHLLATDGDDGKIKIKWNGNRNKDNTDE